MSVVRKTLSFLMPAQKMSEHELNRRSFMRLEGDSVVVSINGTTFEVLNWSQGGLLLKKSNGNAGNVAEDLNFTLQWQNHDDIISLSHHGHVIRQDNDKIAIQLEPLSNLVRKQFSHMIDAALTEHFVHSQTA